MLSGSGFAYGQANAGPDKAICKGSSTQIGQAPSGGGPYCYSWKSSPTDAAADNATTPTITVNPSVRTTYTLRVIGQDFTSVSSDDVVVDVVDNPVFPAGSATVASGATPSNPLASNMWGLCFPENVRVDVSACQDGSNWKAIVTTMKGNYSLQARRIPGVSEVTGPGGNTTAGNFCAQVTDMSSLSINASRWFMVSAIVAHERTHESKFQGAMVAVANNIEALFEAITVPDNGLGQADAIARIKGSAAFTNATTRAQQLWFTEVIARVKFDHSASGAGLDATGLAYIAERNTMSGMISTICAFAKANTWGACGVCPP